jgi:DNA-binding transcriptional MocR family regulator
MGNFYLCNSVALKAGLTKSTFKVYSFLALGANNNTRSCFHSRKTIAAKCKISVSSVIRSCKELCEKGLLEIRKRYRESGKQTTNLYILLDNTQLKIGADKPSNDRSTNIVTKRKVTTKSSNKSLQDKMRLFKCNSSAFNSNLSANTLKVYSYLSLRAGNDGQCMPSKKGIAADCKISLPTVSRAIKKLCTVGLISIIPQTRYEAYGNNGTSVNLYILNAKPIQSASKNIVSTSNAIYLKSLIFCSLLLYLTPSLISPVTPQRTKYRMKVTLKQRKEYLISKLTKCIKVNEDMQKYLFEIEPP